MAAHGLFVRDRKRYADLLLQEDRRVDYPKSVPGIGLVNGKFVDENTTSGTPGSLIPSTWGNSLTDELLNVIEAGGLEPSEVERDQLLEAIRALIEKRVNDASALPIGSMVPFPKGVVPPGFLEVDGSVRSIATYPDLAAYLGTTFNIGSEPAGFFRLPESRGEFLRGWDHGRGVDAGRDLGSTQLDQMQRITGKLDFMNSSTAFTNSTGVFKKTGTSVQSHGGGGGGAFPGDLEFDSAGSVGARAGGETRPRNLAVMWCIKAWSAPINDGVIDIAALASEVQAQKPIAIVGGHKNLALSASGLSAMVNVSADQLIVGAGELVRSLSGVNLSFSGVTRGANGLDVGTLAASTWYSVWVIWNGSAAAGMLSLSATAPTMPVGYTHKARVGWVRTDATANKYPLGFNQFGANVQYLALKEMASGVLTQWSAVSIGAFVPSTAAAVVGRVQNANNICAVAPNASHDLYGISLVYLPSGNGTAAQQFRVVVESANIYGYSTSSGSKISCLGWEDNL